MGGCWPNILHCCLLPTLMAAHPHTCAGFVFVQSRLERRGRKAASDGGGGKGFGAAAQKQQSEPAGGRRALCQGWIPEATSTRLW